MTSTITSNGAYATAATQARQATEKSAEVFKNDAKAFTNQLDAVTLPTVDLTWPVTTYFEYLQMAVDFNRNLATQWAELVNTMSGSVREQAHQVSGIVKDQADTVADLTVKQAEKTEKAKARETKRDDREEAKKAQQQAEEAEEAEKAKARETKRVEREKAKKAQQQAREAYDGLTKTELSDQLAERGLPKTGNVDDLIQRLVSADTE